ncbi:hypothetical protein Esti_001745 [Eimeria stiedai]
MLLDLVGGLIKQANREPLPPSVDRRPHVQGAFLRVSVAEVQRCAAAWLQQQLEVEQQQPAHSPSRKPTGPPFSAVELEDWGPWMCREVCVEGLAVSFTRTRLRGPTPAAAATATAATAAAGYVDTVDIDDGTGVISCRWVWGPPAASSRTAGGEPQASTAAGTGASVGPSPPLVDLGSFLSARGRLLLRRSSGCSCSVKAWLQLLRPLVTDLDPNAEGLAFAARATQRTALSTWQQQQQQQL